MSTAEAFAIINNKSIWFMDKYLGKFNEGSPERNLLEIFAYGTWEDYLKIKDSLPDSLKLQNNSVGERKLKELSILTIMQNEVSYSIDKLMTMLHIDNFMEAEMMLIDLFGSDLIVGKINENDHTLTCERAASRCIPNNPESIQAIIDDLNAFRQRIVHGANLDAQE